MTSPRRSGIVSFLSDFGTGDAYVGVVKAVMLSVHPGLTIVDLTHQVPPQDILEGAFQLMTAVPIFPSGTVHLAVVDPGVGTKRRAVAVELAGYTLVGPDNGLLSLAVQRLATTARIPLREHEGELLIAPPIAAVVLTEARFWHHPVSTTFHGRDVFGPVAAHLARGVELSELGRAVDRLASLPFPEPRRPSAQRIVGQVLHVDRFGNLVTNVHGELVPAHARVRAGSMVINGIRATYGCGPEAIALIGSAGYLELAVPGGNAAERLGLKRGDPIEVESY